MILRNSLKSFMWGDVEGIATAINVEKKIGSTLGYDFSGKKILGLMWEEFGESRFTVEFC